MLSQKPCRFVVAAALTLSCGKDATRPSGDAKAQAPKSAPAAADPAKAAVGGKAGSPQVLAMPLAKGELPNAKLETAAFVADPCALASADQVKGYLSFVQSAVERTTGERRDRGSCVYKADDPEVELEVWFDAGKKLRSSESKVSVGGLDDVTLRILDESVELSIPFDAAKDASKMPADRIFVRLELYRSNRIPTWDAAYRKPDPKALEAAALGLGANLIERLGLGA